MDANFCYKPKTLTIMDANINGFILWFYCFYNNSIHAGQGVSPQVCDSVVSLTYMKVYKFLHTDGT